jgi:DNA-binding transcriptional ArsR family regulator
MTEPLADRLLDVLGDPIARRVVRLLLSEQLSQADLVSRLEVAQSSVSRAVKLLHATGLVGPIEGGRGPRLAVLAPAQMISFLLASDRLAEHLLDLDAELQASRSRETRRLAVKPADESRGGTGDLA